MQGVNVSSSECNQICQTTSEGSLAHIVFVFGGVNAILTTCTALAAARCSQCSQRVLLMIDSCKLAKLTEHTVFSVISQLQNKSQLAFHQLNAFNVKLQLEEMVSLH